MQLLKQPDEVTTVVKADKEMDDKPHSKGTPTQKAVVAEGIVRKMKLHCNSPVSHKL